MCDVTIKQVFNAVDKFNSRPRKCLNFKTPYEVFKELNWNWCQIFNGLCTYDLNSGSLKKEY